jgi:hypothetical protein
MSQVQIDATALLCRLLDRDKAQINGDALFEGTNAEAAAHLVRERLLVLGPSLDYIRCPECWMEQARVIREIAGEQIDVMCPECHVVTCPRSLVDTYKVSFARFMPTLLNGLELTPAGMKVVDPDRIWRLGTTQSGRGKPLTWYFARQLYDPGCAVRTKEQIALEKTIQSSVVLTSSEMPLPVGSPISEFDVRPLSSLGRVSQSKFEFFAERLGQPGPQVLLEAAPGTTLRHVRTNATAFVDGVAYPLEPSQQKILAALIDARDNELDKTELKDACGSQAQSFSPSKEFQRNPVVYEKFIRFLRNDNRYALITPVDDRHWLA